MNKEFLLNYLKTDSPSTFEVESQKTWIEYISNFVTDIKSDNYGNTYATLYSKNLDINHTLDRYKVVIDAHCDEIGWVVSSIEEDGYIRVKKNGGIDLQITPSTNIKILTDNGKINGVFGTTPIHLKDKDKEYKPTIENIFIDVFANSKDEVKEMGIEVGNFVVFDRNPEIINDKYVIGKSLDDKVGGFIIAEVLRTLVEQNIELPYDLYVVNSVQEEVGLRGSKMITDTINPDVAIVFDVHFDTSTPNVDDKKFGKTKMGDGLIFRTGSDVHPNLMKLMKKVTVESKVDYKLIVGGSGGTNTAAYNLSNGGVVTSTISIPLRYMHTPNEIVSLNDIQVSIDYYVELLKNIEYKHNFKLV